MTLEFVPELPPKKTGKTGKIAAEAEELKQRPGEWAIVRRYKGASPAGHYTTYRKYGLEVTARKGDDGTWTIYARWPAP